MIEVIFLIVLALIWIVFAVVQDLKTKEIPNWLNFSLIVFALGFRFFYSLFSSDVPGFSFFYQGLIGFGIFFALGNAFYYGRMFAGGDAKLMIALGAILPFSKEMLINIRIFILFFVLFLFVGALYGLVSSLVVGGRNFKALKSEMGRQFKKNRKWYSFVLLLGIIVMSVSFFSDFLLLYFGLLLFLFPLLHLYAKSIDESCMIKEVKSSRLREGDWLYKNVKLGNKVIEANWDGISKEDVKLLKKRKKNVWIREGIAFSPVFLVSFLVIAYVYLFRPELINLLWNAFG